MWYRHPQQQQRGVQIKPPQPALHREPHALGPVTRCTTTCDVTGARQPGWAKPAHAAQAAQAALRTLENEAGSALP